MTACGPKIRHVRFVSALGGRSRLDMLNQRFSDFDPQRTLMDLHSTTSSTVGLAECRIRKEPESQPVEQAHDRCLLEVGDPTAAEVEIWLLGW